ncbi:MAG: helix-turn-helix domain-containing protein, partial [Janthinobacterium lividum]
GQGPAPSDFTGRVRRFETALLRDALEHARFNQAAAARLLGLGYHQFRHHLRSHALLDTARPSAADADEVA